MSRFAVIMAGGSGTRFWPKSTRKTPKQFLPLTSKRSLLWEASHRLDGLVPTPKRWVVCTQDVAGLVKKQLKSSPLLIEPQGRNTMAAVCWAAWVINGKDRQSSVVVLPADAHIGNEVAYKKALGEAFKRAEEKGRIVCLGIPPTFPATGYGYIENKSDNPKFVEKPSEERALELMKSGYLWNAGIFVFKTSVFINEVRVLAPHFAHEFDQIMVNAKKLTSIYRHLTKIPVDKAIMEKTALGSVISCGFGWNDVGSWKALHEVTGNNTTEGLVRTKRGYEAIDCSDLFIDVTDGKFVGLVGVKDLVVVETKDALLICHKDRTQEIKDLVEKIRVRPKLRDLL